jgi:dolichol-phosphate mannosyltransferase
MQVQRECEARGCILNLNKEDVAVQYNRGQYELTVVLPTFNERDNVAVIISKLEQALKGIDWEVVFVDDDSRDGTPIHIEQAARDRQNVRIIRRIGRRGLSTAVIEGAQSSMAPYIAVMDADLQHDETVLPKMLNALRSGLYELVAGSRYCEGGGVGEWSRNRVMISALATRAAKMATGIEMSDPMSGFFMITRPAFERVVRRLSTQGFKILLDIAASASPPLRVAEIPYQFRARQFGESKLDSMVAIEYVMLLLDKLIGHIVPVRFLLFAGVGGMGLILHMFVLATLIHGAGIRFAVAQSLATVSAMVFNFFVNNFLTYRDRRLAGARQLALGLLSFLVVCSLGAFANVGVANFLFDEKYSWWLSGLAGVLVGAVWNYAVTSVFTWRIAK